MHPNNPPKALTSTVSHQISWKIYATALANTIKTCLPVPIALTLFAALQGQRLERALGEIIGSLLLASIPGYWVEWYKIKYRLTPEFYLGILNTHTVFEKGTLYFFNVVNNNEHSMLYYMSLRKDNQLDIKKISDDNTFDSIIAKIENIENRENLTAEESTQLRRYIDAGHYPSLKADVPHISGHELDNSFFWKCFGSLILPSTVAGGLLGWAVGNSFGIISKLIITVTLALANFLVNMMINPIIIFSAYAASSPGTHLKALPQQPGFALIYNKYFLALLRDWAPAVLSLLSLVSIYQLLKPVSFSLAAVVCLLLYPLITSSFRIFTLDAAEKQLRSAGIHFSMENSFSENSTCRYIAPLMALLGEILSCRWTTVSLWLRCGVPPSILARLLVVGAIVGTVMLLWAPINDDVLCPTKNCFGQGQGTLASFMTSAQLLDAESRSHSYIFQSIFATIITVLVIATAYGLFSYFPNIQEYIEKRRANSARVLPETNPENDSKIITQILKPWSEIKAMLQQNENMKISSIAFTALFEQPTITETSDQSAISSINENSV